MSISFSVGIALAEPEIEVILNPSGAIQVGERYELKVELRWRSAEGKYHFSLPQATLEGLVVEEKGEASEVFQKEGEHWEKKTFRTVLKAVREGKGKIGSFRVHYLDLTQQVDGYFQVPERELPIKPDRSQLYQGMTLALAVAAMGGLVGSWYFLRRTRRRDWAQMKPEISLEESYLERLNQLRESLGDKTPISVLISEGSKCFLSYLNDKYSLSAKNPTGREAVEELKKKVPPDEFKILKGILDRLEQWLYANYQGSQLDGNRLYADMTRFIEGKKVVTIQN